MQVVGVPFCKGCADVDGGDFVPMLSCREFDDCLFLFCDNVRDGLAAEDVRSAGGGSAAIRASTTSPMGRRAVGIPTGWSAGVAFSHLDDQVCMLIDLAFFRAVQLVRANEVRRVLFPCASREARDEIGVHIFRDTIGNDVVEYINDWLTTKLATFLSSNRPLDSVVFFETLARRWSRRRVRFEHEAHCAKRARGTPASLLFPGQFSLADAPSTRRSRSGPSAQSTLLPYASRQRAP